MTLKKIALLKEHDIKPFMGGNVAELALVQGTIEEHMTYAKEMGWDAIEFSETYVTFQYDQKIDMIKRCADEGLEVIYEWGLKRPAEPLNPETAAEDILKYIEAGV